MAQSTYDGNISIGRDTNYSWSGGGCAIIINTYKYLNIYVVRYGHFQVMWKFGAASFFKTQQRLSETNV